VLRSRGGLRATGSRRGFAVFLVLGLILVLGSFGLIMSTLTGASHHQLEGLEYHLRVLAGLETIKNQVASEVAATTPALVSTRAGRWIDVDSFDSGIPDGEVRYWLDVPTEPPDVIDLLVAVVRNGVDLTAAWRLARTVGTLDPHRRYRVRAFVYGPKDIEQARLDLGRVESRRAGDSAALTILRGSLDQARSARSIADILGAVTPGEVLDEIQVPGLAGSSQSRSNGTYLDTVQSSMALDFPRIETPPLPDPNPGKASPGALDEFLEGTP